MRPKVTIFLLLIILLLHSSAHSLSLYVYYPTLIRPSQLEAKIASADTSIHVTVFVRYIDFIQMTRTSPPDLVLVKPEVLPNIEKPTVRLTGVKNGSDTESFLLFSIDKPIDMAHIESYSIGVLGVLDKKETEKTLKKYFTKLPNIQRVNKIADLLSLLNLQMADGVLISENNVSYFAERFNAKYTVTWIPQYKSGIIVLASLGNVDESRIKRFKANRQFTELFAIDGWR